MMKFNITPYLQSNHTISQIENFIMDGKFYELTRFFLVNYQISLGSKYKIEDEDSALVILPSLLNCIKQILLGNYCVLQMSDSPPNVVFQPKLRECIISVDSYGSIIEQESQDLKILISDLRSNAIICANYIKSVSKIDLEHIISELNPGHHDLLDYMNA